MHNPLPIIILIVLGIAVIVSIVRLIKKGFKIGPFISLLFASGFLIFGGFLYMDIVDFGDHFYTSSNIFVLTDDDTVLTGFYGLMETETDLPNFFDEQMIKDMTAWYQAEDYDSMLGDNYKMFIIDIEAFETVENLTIDNEKYTLEETTALIDSDTPTEDYVDRVLARKDIPEEHKAKLKENLMEQTRKDIGNDHDFKGAMFASGLLGSALEEQGTLFLLKNFQFGTIMIYEESMLFKTIKYLPTPYLEAIMDQEE